MTNVQVRTGVCGRHVMAALTGELDSTEAVTAAAAVAALTAAGQRLIIDLRALKFIDCHAVSALLGARKAARQAGGDVLLAAPHGSVLRLLTLLGVPGVHASVADAESAACGQPAARQPAPGTPEGRERGAVRHPVPDDGSEVSRPVPPDGRGYATADAGPGRGRAGSPEPPRRLSG